MLASNGEMGEPCGVPDSGVGDDPALEHPCSQPAPQQLQHLPVNDPALDLAHEGVVVDLVEACLDVGVEHPHRTLVGRLADGFEGLVGGTLRPEAEALGREVRLENGFEDDLRRRHHHPVGDRGDAERPGLPRLARFGDADPPQGLRAIGLLPKFGGEAVEELAHPFCAPGFDVGDGHAVDAGGTLVGGHVDPRPPHHVAAGELVVEGMEPTLWFLLGTAVKHTLEGSNGVQAIGLSDGPSRLLGTHQRSSPPSSCIGEAGALRSGWVVLSRPSSLLRPPPTPSRPPATSRDHRL